MHKANILYNLLVEVNQTSLELFMSEVLLIRIFCKQIFVFRTHKFHVGWNTTDLILPYTNVCTALYTRCFPSVCEKNFTGDSGRIRTHDLLLTSADVLTSQPPSLHDDDWPARIPYISGFRDIYTTQKKLRVKGNVLIIFVSMSSLV